jgi:DNA-binding response OmpR family regulator
MPVALVIEDEPELAAFAIAAFNRFGFDAFVVESVAEALDILERSEQTSVLFINLSREDDELSLVRAVAARWPAIKIILLSARLHSLRDLPPSIFLAKPTTPATIIAIIRRVAQTSGGEPNESRGGAMN